MMAIGADIWTLSCVPHAVFPQIIFISEFLTFCFMPSLQGWYIVTYALFIYHLNLLLAFLTPKIDPAMAELEAEDGKSVKLMSSCSRERKM